jgi:hypothetical protein
MGWYGLHASNCYWLDSSYCLRQSCLQSLCNSPLCLHYPYCLIQDLPSPSPLQPRPPDREPRVTGLLALTVSAHHVLKCSVSMCCAVWSNPATFYRTYRRPRRYDPLNESLGLVHASSCYWLAGIDSPSSPCPQNLRIYLPSCLHYLAPICSTLRRHRRYNPVHLIESLGLVHASNCYWLAGIDCLSSSITNVSSAVLSALPLPQFAGATAALAATTPST